MDQSDCVFGTGPESGKTGAHFQRTCGSYSPQHFVATTTVTTRNKFECMLKCGLDICCNSVRFEERNGTCYFSQQRNKTCSTNVVRQGTSFYKMRPSCPNNWLFFQGSCYLFMPLIRVNRPEAVKLCRLFGAHLVSLQTDEEREFLASKSKAILVAGGMSVSEADYGGWWSSGIRHTLVSDWTNTGNWHWDNCEGGTMENILLWAQGEPDGPTEDASFLSAWGSNLVYVGDISRSYTFPLICEYVL